MPAVIVVGGQYGSEGKGKVVALRAARSAAPWLVRCGGPNSGHTVCVRGTARVMRQVPSCADPDKATFCVAAGCVVDEMLLLQELEALSIPRDRILVDPRAILVNDEDRALEFQGLQHISSTASGTGAALVRRMSRGIEVKLAQDSPALRSRCSVRSVAPLLHHALSRGEDVIVEGTQGFGLSLLHGAPYPFVTSRDTTASGFCSEVGLSPRSVDEIIVVIRTFPIRVGGPSGPFANEISWDEVRVLSSARNSVPEYTSVTNKLRRVARFDLEAVKTACVYNQPTSLAVMGIDRLDYPSRDRVQLVEPKGGYSDRIVSLPAFAISALRRHQIAQEQEREWAGTQWQNNWNLVFTTQIGTPLDERGVLRRFQRLLALNGLPKMRIYDLRHSAVAILIAQGVNIKAISELLGHSSAAFTLQVYGHLLEETKKETAIKMDAALAPAATRVATKLLPKQVN